MSVVRRTVIAMDDRQGSRWFRRLAGTDVDDAIAFFSVDYDLRTPTVRRTSPKTKWDFAGVGDQRMSLRTTRFGVDLRCESFVADEFIVAWVRGGTSTMTTGGESVDLEPGVPVVLPTETAYELHQRDIALSMVHLDRAFVTGLTGDPAFTFEPLRAPTAEGMRLWRSTVQQHSSTWLDMEQDLDDVARRDIAEAFSAAALRAFPQRASWRATVAGNGPEHERLRRALEYVHAHANEPIGTSEIADAAGLSPRGLQQSLRRHLDQTPGELLREVRLEGAHNDLRRADRDELSVAEIARSWGFGHLGRFSAAYRTRFGELPSESLRSRG